MIKVFAGEFFDDGAVIGDLKKNLIPTSRGN